MKLNLVEIAEITKGQLYGDDVSVDGLSTDTRNMQADVLFIALVGDSYDPHEMIEAGKASKAAAVLVQQKVNTTIPQVVVKDTYKALQQLAAAWRKRFNLPVIGVTGSNGKTSVKELIKQILSTQGNVLATVGNLNNHIGVPLTLSNLNESHRFAVIEMGANHAGEIAALAKIAEPNIGVITNIGPAHLEGFGSIEGVVHAKAELYQNLSANGVAVINADEHYREELEKFIGDRMQISFGIEKHADVSGKQISSDQVEIITPIGEIRVKPQVPGMHALLNILAATAVGLALGLDLEDIKTGIEKTIAVPGRLVMVEGLAGASVLDDSYNANPASLAAALDVQAQEPGEHWLVLGDMGELGDEGVFMHKKAAEVAKEFGVTRLFAYGELTKHSVEEFGTGAAHFNNHSKLIEKLQEELSAGVCVLVKGSRAMQLEKIVAGIRTNKITTNKKLNDKANGQNNMEHNEHVA
ncbi:MAG: UDP-N-acetylmuramoyl-tripeptide--D-alanyl-D-alanine ligase [Gammaproteobacteria bacterium]|nr:UDP-N-acetylmuramoyl-tripeptide--D-alanyl-D-alanine ligase [Gammaproteobacteria bacterium]